MSNTTDDRNLAQQHADSLAANLWERSEAGALFGHTDEHDYWHDVNECPDDCEGQQASAMDYLSEALDFRYIVDKDRTYRHGQVCISLGGPNVWIYTEERQLHVWWGFDHAAKNIPTEFCRELDEALAEFWEMGA